MSRKAARNDAHVDVGATEERLRAMKAEMDELARKHRETLAALQYAQIKPAMSAAIRDWFATHVFVLDDDVSVEITELFAPAAAGVEIRWESDYYGSLNPQKLLGTAFVISIGGVTCTCALELVDGPVQRDERSSAKRCVLQFIGARIRFYPELPLDVLEVDCGVLDDTTIPVRIINFLVGSIVGRRDFVELAWALATFLPDDATSNVSAINEREVYTHRELNVTHTSAARHRLMGDDPAYEAHERLRKMGGGPEW